MENNKDTVQKQKKIIGCVVGCDKLRIRKRPNVDSDIVSLVDVGTELQINDIAPNDKFYAVRTPEGKFGFCMKDYVDIRG